MTAAARDIVHNAAEHFLLPACWEPARWRPDVVLGAGLTALAAEAVLLDVGHGIAGHGVAGYGAAGVLTDPERTDAVEDDGRGILGCSASGRSAEVVDGLARLRRRGFATGLVSAHADADVRLPAMDAPRTFHHLPFCAVLPNLIGRKVASLDVEAPAPSVYPFLLEVYRSGLTPLFVSCGGFLSRLLRGYWIEFLHRPAFVLPHPEWTHDFLWSTVRSGQIFAWVVEAPRRDLSDGRFRRLREWLSAQDTLSLVLPPSSGRHVSNLVAATDRFAEMANELGIDLSTELEFGAWGKVVER